MAEGLHVFDKSVQEANIWLKDIGQDFGGDEQKAFHALRSTLHALRDRITVHEATDLGAQLPTLIKGVYYDQWRPQDQPKKYSSKDEFLQEVEKGLTAVAPASPEHCATAVFKALDKHLDSNEIANVKQQLPDPVRRMWH